MAESPLVSVAVPVWNGEQYLVRALDSILAQTLTDFEVVILDNASTDSTPAIAQGYVARDPRVRYIRHPQNIGSNPNFNAGARATAGRYLKWLAADDAVDPTFLERCVAVLEADPSIALCTTQFRDVGPDDELLGHHPYRFDLSGPDPAKRFGNLMCGDRGQRIMMGVIRRDVLDHTRLLADYVGSDRAFVGEIALHGRIVEIPEELWSSREHPQRSTHVRNTRVWDPRPRRSHLVLYLDIARELGRIIRVSPLTARQRIACVVRLGTCLARRAGRRIAAPLRGSRAPAEGDAG
jgi:glycosyltransferase involved in cell wall biosynthesis